MKIMSQHYEPGINLLAALFPHCAAQSSFNTECLLMCSQQPAQPAQPSPAQQWPALFLFGSSTAPDCCHHTAPAPVDCVSAIRAQHWSGPGYVLELPTCSDTRVTRRQCTDWEQWLLEIVTQAQAAVVQTPAHSVGGVPMTRQSPGATPARPPAVTRQPRALATAPPSKGWWGSAEAEAEPWTQLRSVKLRRHEAAAAALLLPPAAGAGRGGGGGGAAQVLRVGLPPGHALLQPLLQDGAPRRGLRAGGGPRGPDRGARHQTEPAGGRCLPLCHRWVAPTLNIPTICKIVKSI